MASSSASEVGAHIGQDPYPLPHFAIGRIWSPLTGFPVNPTVAAYSTHSAAKPNTSPCRWRVRGQGARLVRSVGCLKADRHHVRIELRFIQDRHDGGFVEPCRAGPEIVDVVVIVAVTRSLSNRGTKSVDQDARWLAATPATTWFAATELSSNACSEVLGIDGQRRIPWAAWSRHFDHRPPLEIVHPKRGCNQLCRWTAAGGQIGRVSERSSLMLGSNGFT
jgi:hypothetical protein